MQWPLAPVLDTAEKCVKLMKSFYRVSWSYLNLVLVRFWLSPRLSQRVCQITSWASPGLVLVHWFSPGPVAEERDVRT